MFADKGEVFGWGNSEYRQLRSNGDDQQICTPIHLDKLKGKGRFADVAAGGSFCIVVNGIIFKIT